MHILYRRFWQERACREAPRHKLLAHRVPGRVPGNLYDRGGNKHRFNRWYKLPQAAHKLYWRTHRDQMR